MVAGDEAGLIPYDHLPDFWSQQFGLNIKLVGLPTGATNSPSCWVRCGIAGSSACVRRAGAKCGRCLRRQRPLAARLPGGGGGGDAFPTDRRALDQADIRLNRWPGPCPDRIPHHRPTGAHVNGTLFQQILDPANRADPYPLYAEMRRTPVSRQDDGSLRREHSRGTLPPPARSAHQLGGSARSASIPLDRASTERSVRAPGPQPDHRAPSSLHLPRSARPRPPAPAGHARVFAPARVRAMHRKAEQLTHALLDGLRDRTDLDLVDDFSYPLPVTVICELLGVRARTSPGSKDGRLSSPPPSNRTGVRTARTPAGLRKRSRRSPTTCRD